jgi:rRNA maturation protein Nop10
VTKNDQNENTWFWVIAGFCCFATLVGSCSDSGSSTTYTPTPNRSSVEHKYATERFRQEGLSNKDAQQAADAVIKFHNAQKNR